MGAFGGFVFGLFLGVCLAVGVHLGGRLRMAAIARSRKPVDLDGGEYYVVPAEEYGHLVTARDLTRAAVNQMQAKRHLSDPFIDRRRAPRIDPGNDLDLAGRPLKPGS